MRKAERSNEDSRARKKKKQQKETSLKALRPNTNWGRNWLLILYYQSWRLRMSKHKYHVNNLWTRTTVVFMNGHDIKYTENRNLALFPKPSSLKPSICRNNIHSSLKTNKQTKQLLLPNPSNVTVHQILSIRSFKAQLKICFLCAFYWLSVLPMHSAYCHIL